MSDIVDISEDGILNAENKINHYQSLLIHNPLSELRDFWIADLDFWREYLDRIYKILDAHEGNI